MSEKTPLNDDNQPSSPRLNRHQNTNKALQDLYGILLGISSDRMINADETLFLDTWLRDNAILRDDPDYRDLIELTTDILADGRITQEEEEDILGLVDCIIEHRIDDGFANDKQAVQRMLGIFKGISADLLLKDLEVFALNNWLQRFEAWTDNPVANHIRHRLKTILQSGTISEMQRLDLLSVLQNVSGSGISDGATGGMSIRLDWDTPPIEFASKSFCFTGKMSRHPRSECIDMTKQRGGIIHKTVTNHTDYLVIGDLSSRDWAHSAFGRKIESAIEKRGKGVSRICIIEEQHWLAYIGEIFDH